MRILLLSPLPPYRGGIAQFGGMLLKELTRRNPDTIGINYSKLYPGPLFPGKSQLEEGSSPPEGLLHGYNPVKWTTARGQIRRLEPDLIISQWWHPFFAPCLRASIPRGIRRAAVCHNILPHENTPLADILSRGFLTGQDLLAVHSAGAENRARSISENVIRLFHPIYDQYRGTGLPREEARAELGLREHHTALLFFGLVREYKGLDILIKACEELPENFRIIAAGENYTGNRYSSDRMYWENRFIPDGEVGTWFNASDMVVLPYRTATQSGVAQIAMAFEKPLVVTPAGGLPEVVNQGVTGSVARDITPEALAEAVLECSTLVNSEDTGERIREKAKSYSWETYVSRLLEAAE